MPADANGSSGSSSQRWERIRTVFHAALEQPASLRDGFLSRACHGDPSLRAEVATLLRAHVETGAFIDSPIVQTLFTIADPRTPGEPHKPSPPALDKRVISHYELKERLGAGGMGEVYRAVDTALGREAALKVLPDGFTPALRDRLLHEGDACARLQHPAIATSYESGEADGVAFIAMEFVRGQTLRERVREGPLGVDEAITVTQCLLEALSHAHALGILHRDIKPENIIVARGGAAKLVDFGIAKHLVVAEPDVITAVLTHGGSSFLGTIGYMSPEQVRNELLDVRSDLFQVGAVLYEMLSGRPAFTGTTMVERLAAILSRDPAPLSDSIAGRELDMVIHRALARERERRYPSAAVFLSDLLKVTAGEWSPHVPAALAVLDFQNLMDVVADEWIGSGIAENLGLDLGRTATVTVVAREKVLKARQSLIATGITSRAAELGLALGCRWVVAGAYRRFGSALRVTAHVVEAATGRSLVTETVDGTLEQIFDIQDRIAEITRAALAMETAADHVRQRTTLSAYECYAHGQRLVTKLEKGSFDQALQFFEEAVQQDPKYAKALTGQYLCAAPYLHDRFRRPGDGDVSRSPCDRC